MAKLINLFGDTTLSGRELVTSSPKNLNDMAVSGVVSPSGVQYALEIMNRVTPKIDYSDFSNFVFFNSALDYFNITGDRMIAEYPYDQTYDDYLAFKSSSDAYENYMIDAWPRWSGSGYFSGSTYAIVGDTSVSRGDSSLLVMSTGTSGTFNVPLTLEYRLMFPPSSSFPPSGSAAIVLQHVPNTGSAPRYADPNYAVFLGSGTINFYLSGSTFSGGSGSIASAPIPNAAVSGVGFFMAWTLDPASGTLTLYKTNPGSSAFPFTDAFNVDGYGVPIVNVWTFTTGTKQYPTGSSVFLAGKHLSTQLPGYTLVAPNFQLTELRYWAMARDSADIYRTYNNRVFKDSPLRLYWRFAEPYTFPYNGSPLYVRDYSGHKLDGRVGGTSNNVNDFWISATSRPGGIGMSPQDTGEPLLSPRAQGVIDYVSPITNPTSGTAVLHDRNNPNLITNLVPQQYIQIEDDQNTAVMKNLLYLLGRQFDELKVSIDQTTHLLTADYTEFNTTPDALLDEVLNFWGWSTKGNFLSKEAFQWFFGLDVIDRTKEDIKQGVYSNERLEVELFQIKNEFWRRTLNNLAYLYKTKGTKESVDALFRVYGLDESVVKLKEYGLKPFVKIETNRINSLKSHSVFKADRNLTGGSTGSYGVQTNGQVVGISSGTWTVDMQIAFPAWQAINQYVTRSMAPISATPADATGSIYHFEQGLGGGLAQPLAFPLGSVTGTAGVNYEHLYYEREYRNGTLTHMGRLIYLTNDGTELSVTFDDLPIFDGRWYHLSVQRNGSTVRLDIQFNDTDRMGVKPLDNSPVAMAIPYTATRTLTSVLANIPTKFTLAYAPVPLFKMGQFWTHNLQIWSLAQTDTERADHTINPFSHGAETPERHTHLELNWQFDTLIDSDNTTYLDSTYPSYNGVLVGSGTEISGQWSANTYDRYNFSYNFIAPPDYNWTEEKIRYLDTPRPDPRDHWNEINDVGIEFNLIDALNEDISYMMSTMDNWNNIVGDPANRYRDNYPTLEKLRQQYFTRLTGRINFRVFIDYLDFFDRSFIEIVKRLLPARIDFQGAEIVIESHMLERPKVQYSYRRQNPQLVPEGVIRIYGLPPLSIEWMTVEGHWP